MTPSWNSLAPTGDRGPFNYHGRSRLDDKEVRIIHRAPAVRRPESATVPTAVGGWKNLPVGRIRRPWIRKNRCRPLLLGALVEDQSILPVSKVSENTNPGDRPIERHVMDNPSSWPYISIYSWAGLILYRVGKVACHRSLINCGTRCHRSFV